MLRIAIDVMSGDFGLRSAIPAVATAIAENPRIHLTLVGDRADIEAEVARLRLPAGRISIVHAPDVVAMDEKPSVALRAKRESSLWKSLELLRDGQVRAVVSAGNTGALMAMGRYLLQTLPGIDRPAICAPIPSLTGHTYLLDLGANVDCSAQELHQFATMGSALAEIHGMAQPRVALLNIGEELIKGNEQVKAAAKLLAEDAALNYIGNIEGNDIFSGAADVVVCDGFVGNVALKVCEGTASLIGTQLRNSFSRNWYGVLGGLLLQPLLKRFHRKIDPQQYNGAALLGLRGVVIKSHGSSSAESFACAIQEAAAAVEQSLPQRIERQLGAATAGKSLH